MLRGKTITRNLIPTDIYINAFLYIFCYIRTQMKLLKYIENVQKANIELSFSSWPSTCGNSFCIYYWPSLVQADKPFSVSRSCFHLLKICQIGWTLFITCQNYHFVTLICVGRSFYTIYRLAMQKKKSCKLLFHQPTKPQNLINFF